VINPPDLKRDYIMQGGCEHRMGFDVLPIRSDVARIIGFGCQRGVVAAQSYLLSIKFRGIFVELGFQVAKLHSNIVTSSLTVSTDRDIFENLFFWQCNRILVFRHLEERVNVMLWICCDSTIVINDLDRDPP
jgi:hypothetical protein